MRNQWGKLLVLLVCFLILMVCGCGKKEDKKSAWDMPAPIQTGINPMCGQYSFVQLGGFKVIEDANTGQRYVHFASDGYRFDDIPIINGAFFREWGLGVEGGYPTDAYAISGSFFTKTRAEGVLKNGNGIGQIIKQTNFTALLFSPKKLSNLNFNPYLNGENPNVAITEEQILHRTRMIRPFANAIRSFGCTGGLEYIFDFTHYYYSDTQFVLGAIGTRINNDLSANDREIQSLISLANADHVYDLPALIVGSGALSRGEITEEQLLVYIDRVRSAVTEYHPVTYADDYNVLLAHPAIINACDVIYANFYPFREGININQAIEHLNQDYLQLKAACGNKTLVIAETGWPDAGMPIGEAMPSPENAKSYFIQLRDWAKQAHIGYYYFEAFDEAWRETTEGPSGGHWGICDEYGVLKPYMEDVFYPTL